MYKVRNIIFACLLLVIAVLGLYGCGGDATATPVPIPTDTVAPPADTPVAQSAPTEAATVTPVPNAAVGSNDTSGAAGTTSGSISGPAADLLNKSQEAMKNVNTFHFLMELKSADGSSNLTGEGDFEKPDKAHITIKNISGTVGTVDMIVIGNDTYMQQPGSQQYMSLGGTGSGLLNLGQLSNPGQTSSIAQFANSADIVGDEKLDGVDTTHITFTYDVDKAMQAGAASDTSGAVATALAMATPTGQQAKADMWIAKDTNYIHKISFVTDTPSTSPQANPVATPNQTTVSVTYSKFNEPVNPPIEKPTNIITLPGSVGTPVP